jgi:hypothetical protein
VKDKQHMSREDFMDLVGRQEEVVDEHMQARKSLASTPGRAIQTLNPNP